MLKKVVKKALGIKEYFDKNAKIKVISYNISISQDGKRYSTIASFSVKDEKDKLTIQEIFRGVVAPYVKLTTSVSAELIVRK